MRTVNVVALVLVTIASALSVIEFVTSVLSGGFPTEPGEGPTTWLVRLVHLVADVGVLTVLLRNARAIDAGRRLRTVLRLVLVGTLAVYLVSMTALTLFVPEIGDLWQGPAEGFPWWFNAVQAVGLLGLVVPWVLGITMLVQGNRSPAAWLLAVAAPVHLATLLLPFVLGSIWVALPLSGVLTNVGLALLGAHATENARSRAVPPDAG